MRRLWLWIWLAVLTGQLTSLWVVKRFVPPFDPAVLAVEPALLELANETAAAWETAIEMRSPPVIPLTGNPLMVREEWLLKIRDAERTAREKGMEVRVTEALTSWLQASKSGLLEPQGQEDLIAYLMDIETWLGNWSHSSVSPGRDRLILQPDATVFFPALQFELEGGPGEMASLLHAHTSRSLNWKLRELDLMRQPDGTGWWLRGSCVYRNSNAE